MKRLIFVALLALLAPGIVLSDATKLSSPDQIKEQHRVAARKYLDTLTGGLKLSGKLVQNDSPGTFEAYFYKDSWLIKQTFGDIVSLSYKGPEGSWSGSNYGLPYKIEPQDSPASAVLEMLSDGAYLSDPLWATFTYVGEDAGGYNFRFAPPGLPPVDVVLYSDPEDPQYLQVMGVSLSLAPNDPDCLSYRAFYYYEVDAQGRIYSKRETGREVDPQDTTVSFTDFDVEHAEYLTQPPPELKFDFARTPVGQAGAALTAPVEVPVDADKGYFIVPVQFTGSDRAFKFLLDTGASASLFSPDAATAAGLKPVLNVTGHGHGSRASFEMGMCTTASIGAQSAPDAQVRAPLMGFPATLIPDTNKDILGTLQFYGADGILGVSVLNQYVVRFDYPGHRIVLYPANLFNADKDVPRPNIEIWLDVEDLVYCKARLNGQLEGQVVVDTGLQQDMSLLSETLNTAGITLEKVEERNNTVLGGVKKFSYVKVPLLELGPLEMRDKIASLTEDDQGNMSARHLLGFIGMSMFVDGPVTLDLFAQRMYIEAPAKLGYFPGLTPPPSKEQGEAKPPANEKTKGEKGDEKHKKTELPIKIGCSPDRVLG